MTTKPVLGCRQIGEIANINKTIEDQMSQSPPVLLSAVEAFFARTIIVVFATIALLMFSVFYVKNEIELAVSKAGPALNLAAEQSLYRLAVSNDLPPEKKAKVLAALAQIGQKYGPYFDALQSR